MSAVELKPCRWVFPHKAERRVNGEVSEQFMEHQHIPTSHRAIKGAIYHEMGYWGIHTTVSLYKRRNDKSVTLIFNIELHKT